MLRLIAKQLFHKLPQSFQDEYQYQRNIKEGRKIIFEWEKRGKPLPPPHAVKQRLIHRYQENSGIDVMIETGTLTGGMIDAQRKNFKEIYSIELSEELWRKACERFKLYDHIKLIQGDSGTKMVDLTTKLNQPAIFWLDGHYSAGNTAMGDVLCPVIAELNAILRNSDLRHIILIDDARNFNGTDTYPTVDEIKLLVASKRKNFSYSVDEDVIQIVLN